MKPQRVFKVRGEGVAIRMGEWPGPGAPVLCVHGLTSNLMSFAGLAPALSPRHRVLAMDLRGRGGSDKPATGYSIAQHCRDIKAVLADLGLERAALMGHSLGAYIALEMAATYPQNVERLILLDGGADLSREQWAAVGLGIGPSVERLGQVWPSREAFLDLMRQSPLYRPWNRVIEEYFLQDLEEVAGGVRSRVNPEHVAQERAALARVVPSRLHPRVACPTLIVRAGRGMQAPERLLLPRDALERMLGAMPRARVAEMAQADHFSLVFQPSPARDRAILDFLAEA